MFRLPQFSLLIYLPFFLAGCVQAQPVEPTGSLTSLSIQTVDPTPLPFVSTAVSTRTPTIIADCGWSALVSAWVDTNGNGERENGELAFPGVKFFFNSINSPSQYQRGPFITNSVGETRPNEFMPGCPTRTFEIYPELPTGYRLTTAPKQLARAPGFDFSIAFGFAPLAGSETTPIPQRAAFACTPHKLLDSNDDEFLSDLAIAPDGSVWAALFGKGAAHYMPEQDRWTYYSQADGLVGKEVRRITITSDKAVWFATTSGASRFDGKTWTSYTTKNGLVHDNVRQVAEAKDGTLWFATRFGVSHFDPVQNRWQNFTSRDGLAYDFTTQVAMSIDGSVWISTVGKGISRLLPGTTTQWRTYTENPSGNRYPKVDSINDLETDPQGNLWIGSLGGVLQFEPHGERWTNYINPLPTTGYDEFAHSIAFAQDGSLWIGTGVYPPQLYHVMLGKDGQSSIWTLYDVRDGLPKSHAPQGFEDSVVSVEVAPDSAVWVGTIEYATRCIVVK